MVEELLELLVGVVDAELLEAVEAENLETGDVKDTDEGGALPLGPVQGPVDPGHNPFEKTLKSSLSNGFNGKLNLFLFNKNIKRLVNVLCHQYLYKLFPA